MTEQCYNLDGFWEYVQIHGGQSLRDSFFSCKGFSASKLSSLKDFTFFSRDHLTTIVCFRDPLTKPDILLRLSYENRMFYCYILNKIAFFLRYIEEIFFIAGYYWNFSFYRDIFTQPVFFLWCFHENCSFFAILWRNFRDFLKIFY